MNVPVWMYWEGPCPEWIKACQRTVFAHAPDVRLLTPDEFNWLRTTDRDIDLARLLVAHRADFIRAYLLAQYGGIWVDSDCLVMRPLQLIGDLLDQYDFVAHYERQGHISNGFLAARPGSQNAAAYYRRVCEILRSGQPLSWLSLGAHTLTPILAASCIPWYRLGYDLIQPVCWSNPGTFFAVNDRAGHDWAFNEYSFCYMLSNNTVAGFQAAHPTLDMLSEGTFFTYLLERALGQEPIPHKPRRRSAMGTSNWQQIPFCVDALLDIAPMRVLDVGVGFGRWGVLVREFCEVWKGRIHRDEWRVWLEGIEVFPQNVEEYHHLFYSWVQVGDAAEIIGRMTDRWDLVIFGDVLEHWYPEDSHRILNKALDLADYVLVNIPIGAGWAQGAAYGNPYEEHKSFWEVHEFLAMNPIRHALLQDYAGRDYGTFLLSRADPRNLQH